MVAWSVNRIFGNLEFTFDSTTNSERESNKRKKGLNSKYHVRTVTSKKPRESPRRLGGEGKIALYKFRK